LYLSTNCTALTATELSLFDNITSATQSFLQVQCVSMPPIAVNNASTMNALLFSGYGKGTPGSVGARTNISAYPFAVDFGASVCLAHGAGLRFFS
jgi:hypothetical protein